MKDAAWESVDRALELIETDIGGPLTLENISQRVGLSRFHLHRVFRALTGFSLMTYVRGRRLSRSLEDLLGTDRTVLQIALEYGFSYEQSYERAFRQLFHISPSGFRRECPQVTVVPRCDLRRLSRLDDGVLTEPRFVYRPRFCLAGIEQEVVHETNQRELTANQMGREFFYEYATEIPQIRHPNVYYGLVRHSTNSLYSDFYMPSVEVAPGITLPEPFTVRTLPRGTYAVFRYIGFHAPEQLTIRTLQQLYGHVFEQWLPDSRWRLRGYHFERMDLGLCSREYCQADVYFPVDAQ